MRSIKSENIEHYISGFPADVQKKLWEIHATIRKVAPKATEAIKYGMPTFVLNGNLVHFAAFKSHIGFYPAPMGIEAFRKEAALYEAGKGTLQFPLDKKIPFSLISKITKYRVRQNTNKPKGKGRKGA